MMEGEGGGDEEQQQSDSSPFLAHFDPLLCTIGFIVFFFWEWKEGAKSDEHNSLEG
jgi:hypothetical protein